MYPVVDIICTERGNITQKAEVLEYKQNSLRVVIQGTDLTIDLRREGNIFVGRQAGLEFVCTATIEEIKAQKNINHR